MKKIFMLFGALMLILNAAMAQTCPFKVKFEVIPASCYNNGKVAYALVDASDNVITTAPSGLTQVRAYYIMPGDTAKHFSGLYLIDAAGNITATGWDTLTINYGNYTIGVEGLCFDGNGYVKKDTSMPVEVTTTYVKPTASAMYTTAHALDDFGKWPSLSCANTGRVQLKIENGAFPYNIAVVDHATNATLRNVVFNERQYDGTNLTKYNYKDYYTIDSLPGGNWDFYLVDGCGYGLPRTGQIVEVIDFPKLDYVEVHASTGNFQDSNIVKINAVLDRDFSFYTAFMPEYAEYRFTYDGTPSSDWKPFPPVLSGYRATLRDTVGHNYCDILDKNITLEYRLKKCGSTTVSKSFKLNRPNAAQFDTDYSDTRDSVFVQDNTCIDKFYWHRWFHKIKYKHNNPSNVNKNDDHANFRHHYTHPLSWVYRDTQKDSVIKVDVIANIATESFLYADEVESIYGSFRDYTYAHPLNLPIERSLVDAKGCVLYTRFDSLPYCYDIGEQLVDWKMEKKDGDHCCTEQGSIRVWENHSNSHDPDGTTIKLTNSPYNGRYNFTAVYSSATHSWTISKNNLENVATIQGAANGRELTMKDYCLPSGPYEFLIMTPCDTIPLAENFVFPDVYSTEITEEPVFSSSQQCTDHYITYTAGSFARVSRSTNPATGEENAPVVEPLNTYFQIISGPTGGYDATLHQKNEPLRISMPGTFVVRVAPSTSLEVCGLPYYYDTIYYDGATVDFEYAYAYLCNDTCTSGTAYVKGANGTPPYTYTLYDQADKQGNVVMTQTIADPDQPATFPDELMNVQHEMSCLVEDACGAYFHVNFYPRTMADLQKVWFDGGVTSMTTCEGSTLQVHALEIGTILEYKWYNPSHQLIDSVSSPTIFVPRGAENGWYKVEISHTGCVDMFVDSVYLSVEPSPTISLASSDTVCPGQEVTLSFTPESPINQDLTFTIAFENGDGVTTRTYSTESGVAVSDQYTTYTNAKIYPLSIDDGNCHYTFADENDTIYIRMREEIADACTLIGSHDTVCYGGDARFAALSTMPKPYTIRWYSDYEMTHLLMEETMTASGPDTSYYDTLGVTRHSEVFVSVQKDGYCPTVYGLPNTTVNMTTGETTLQCGKVLRVYDNGGPDGDYTPNQIVKHTYRTTDGKPVTIHFDELNLSETAHLFVISGSNTTADSMLYDLSKGSPNPGLITSNGDALTLYFLPGMKAGSGWNAIVEHSPGMATADVWKRSDVVIRDEVCQSQTRTYDDPYNVVAGGIVDNLETLNKNIRKAGTYIYNGVIEGGDIHGCDSTVTFILTVNAPPHHDTTVVTTNLIVNNEGGYLWPLNGRRYTTTGRYSKLTTLADGCDSLDVLNLIVLEIDTFGAEICRTDSAQIGVSVTVPDLNSFSDDLVPAAINLGDVLCDDGSIMNADDFLTSGKIAKGIIFYVDSTGNHGLAVALTYVLPTNPPSWTGPTVSSHVSTSIQVAVRKDFDGYQNTLNIKGKVEESGSTQDYTDVLNCYYYDHRTESVGTAHLGWYEPSLGETTVLNSNRYFVNTSLEKLGKNLLGEGLDDNTYDNFATSTEYYPNNYQYHRFLFYLDNDGRIYPIGSKNIRCFTYPVIRF